MSKAMVVLSGGLDSCVALTLAMRENDECIALSFNYGQRHAKMENEASKEIAEVYDVEHHELWIPLGQGNSVLMHADAEMPKMTYEELHEAEGPSPTYVPYRNGTFLSLAASGALDTGCDLIYAGMHGEDAHNWAYPDCTPEFIGAMQNAIYIGTYMKVRLVCPFTYMTKSDIVKLGIRFASPLHLTRSCYEGRDPACGVCPTCIARLEAFNANDISDPISYEFDRHRRGAISSEAVEDIITSTRKGQDERNSTNV